MEKRKASVMGRVLLVVLGVTFLILCLGVTASARGRKLAREERQKQYLESKETVVREIREYLGKKGYPSSGVTLTKREFGEDEEEYRLTVHHGRMEHLSQEERDALTEELSGFASGFGQDAVMLVTIR